MARVLCFNCLLIFLVICLPRVYTSNELSAWRQEVMQSLIKINPDLDRQKRQTSCEEFPCKSGGGCIKYDNVCDGHGDCSDLSDEHFGLCSQQTFSCPSFAYRCSYGACVDGSALCNNVLDCIDKSDELQPECEGQNRTSTNTACKDTEFACLSDDQCIARSQKCDGLIDCKDGSDETITECSSVRCEPYAFRCAYGACVDGTAPCDGIKQCHDGSDEYAPGCSDNSIGVTETPVVTNPPVTKPIPMHDGKSCKLPSKPNSGSYFSYSCELGSSAPECQSIEGTEVPHGFDLHFQCNAGFGLRGGPSEVICRDGEWSPKPPTCSDKCEPLISNRLLISCNTASFGYLNCLNPMPAGARAIFKCLPVSYTLVEDPGYSKIVCKDGEWDKPLVENFCQPVCGKALEPDYAQPLTSEGVRTKHGEFPWHVGIYEWLEERNNWVQTCGGTLINEKVVVSAAHCFYNEFSGKITPKNVSNIRVTAGKYFREWNSTKEYQEPQKREVESFQAGLDYKGFASYYADDIAFVVLKKPFRYMYGVAPICIDVGKHSFEEDQLRKDATAQAVGWGWATSRQPDNALTVVTLPFVPRDVCLRTVSKHLTRYITRDKMCAGVKSKKVNVCPGDSGGGLVFKDEKTETFYLRGVVSLGTTGCRGQDYALFTRIARHKDLLEEFMLM